jgi:DNA-binding response OmpR family regulator
VIEAIEIGVNEFLLKPVSSKALRDRMVAVMTQSRPAVRSGDYYGPVPRRLLNIHEENDNAGHLVVLS